MRWIHAAAMGAALVLVFAGMLFPRCLKRRKWWLKVHRLLAACGAALGAAGAGIAVYQAASSRAQLRVLHSGFGAGALALLIGTPLLGSVMLGLRRNPKLFRAIHRWCGRAAILAMAVTGVLGLLQAGIMRR